MCICSLLKIGEFNESRATLLAGALQKEGGNMGYFEAGEETTTRPPETLSSPSRLQVICAIGEACSKMTRTHRICNAIKEEGKKFLIYRST